MQSINTIVLAHGEIPALKVRQVMAPGCKVPHVLVQSLDDTMGILGHPDDLMILAECLKCAVELQARHIQESAKNHGKENV